MDAQKKEAIMECSSFDELLNAEYGERGTEARRLAGTVLLDYFSPKSCGGHKGFHFFITPVSGTLYRVCWILLYTSVPPFEEVILPYEVVQVEGFLYA